MKNRKMNIGYLLCLTLLLLLLLAACMFFQSASPSDSISLEIAIGDHAETIHLFDDKAYTLYGFLPADIRFSDISVKVTGSAYAELRGCDLRTISNLDGFEADTPYDLSFWDGFRTKNYQVVFLKSENIASMYVDTSSGKMSRIHAKKTNRENVRVSMIDENGIVYADNGFDAELRGHGNTSWGRDKKPYNLYLPEDGDLLGRGSAKNWVLLANVIDTTHLRNDIVYAMARDTAPVWSAGGRYVDLYLNGDYAGLYFLADKVEVDKNRIDLSSNGRLYGLEITDRVDKSAVVDVFPDISAEVRYPKKTSRALLSQVSTELHDLFDAVVAHSLTDAELADRLDLESWAWMYLVQEISCNYDSGVASLFFYEDGGKLTAGSAWDYDNSLGSWAPYNSRNFFAAETVRTPLWRSLMAYDSFREAVINEYRQEFEPWLDALLSGGIQSRADMIRASDRMNLIRWHALAYKRGAVSMDDADVEFLTDFIRNRKELLDDAWISGDVFHNIRIEMAGSLDGVLEYYAAPSGTTIGQMLDDLELLPEYQERLTSESGEKIDLSDRITGDMVIHIVPEAEEEPQYHFPSNKREIIDAVKMHQDETITVLSVLIFILTFLVISILGYGHRNKRKNRKRRQS